MEPFEDPDAARTGTGAGSGSAWPGAAGEPEPSPPRLTGYRVHRLLGSGSSASVWSATAPDGADVALKVVDVPAADDDGPWALAQRAASVFALHREISALTRVVHPRVVALRAVVAAERCVVLVLDRAAGGSLGALVRARGSLDVGEVVELVSGLAGVLAELHERGVVHGDVAPGNVLFDADGTALLADLGLASVVEAFSAGPASTGPAEPGSLSGEPLAPGRGAGTPGFADPAARAGRPTPAGDVHGLAALAWFALTSSAPAPASHRVPLSMLVPDAPAALVQLLDDAMSPVPARRPTAAALGAAVAGSAEATSVHLVPAAADAPPAELLTQRLRAAARAAQAEEAQGARVPVWRRARRGVGAVAAVALVLLGAWSLSGWLMGGDPPASRTTADAGAGTASSRDEVAAPPRGSTATPETPPEPTAESGPSGAPGTEEAADEAGYMRDPGLADPALVVAALADERARALEAADVSLLETVDAGGSAAHAADAEAITALTSAGASVDDLAFEVVSAEAVEVDEGAGTARVEASVTTSAHRQRLADGTLVDVPASIPVTSVLVLRLTDDGWRVERTA